MSEHSTSTLATVYADALHGEDGPPRKCQIVVIEGPDMGRAAVIDEEPVTIGTGLGCDLVITDERVSRQHLVIERGESGFLVRDLDSRNGTLYRGALLKELMVPAGATLKIGHSFVRLMPQPEILEVTPSQSRRCGDLVAESLEMREVFAVLELVAQSDATLLLEGETGTGKELAARAVHEASSRHRQPFVVLDCGALPENLIESELFGHVRGAFTGASSQRSGAFMRAHKGTLFLDELGSVPRYIQARLLRVLEERKVRPVGADIEREVDVRIIAASRHDLSARVAEGEFRPDLLYRLSVVRVCFPPLRQRREDIGPIVTELLRRRGFQDQLVTGSSLNRLIAHSWPGNVRELRNVIERAIVLSPGARTFSELRISVVPMVSENTITVRTDISFGAAKKFVLERFEMRYLRDVFERHQGNISAAARSAEMDRKHMRSLLKKYGIIGD